MHEMRTVATGDPVERRVCQSVCLTRACALQNGRTNPESKSGVNSWAPGTLYSMGVSIPSRNGTQTGGRVLLRNGCTDRRPVWGGDGDAGKGSMRHIPNYFGHLLHLYSSREST